MKFIWEKKGMLFDSNVTPKWAKTSMLTPTPFLLNEKIIRIYGSFRDEKGIGRIGYIDVEKDNPKNILKISEHIVLDIGRDGCFDDNGIILGDIIMKDERLYMYYIGFQLVNKAKFLAFTGLAFSDDGGETFERIKDAPVLDRDVNANMINAVHSSLKDEEGYKIYHAKGDGWEIINGIPYPQYNIWVSTSKDGIQIEKDSKLCIDNKGLEYRIGRPSVYRVANKYLMFYTKGSKTGKDYYPGIALSNNGVDWYRQDELFGIKLSENGWDSEHIAYPRLLKVESKKYYVFYNGNNMGSQGTGYAELVIEE